MRSRGRRRSGRGEACGQAWRQWGRQLDSGEGGRPGGMRRGELWRALSRPGLPAWTCSFPDINECLQQPGTCAYQCQNLQGGYRCLCPPGQTLLRDGKTCTPLEQSEQNVTTVSHRGPLVPWLRPRTPNPRGSYQAWVSLRPGPGALSSKGRAWCPAGFIRQNGVCTGKAQPQPSHWGHAPLQCVVRPGRARGHHTPCSETRGSRQAGWEVQSLSWLRAIGRPWLY